MTPLFPLVALWMVAAMVQGNVDPGEVIAILDPSTDDGHDEAIGSGLAPFFVRLHLVRHGETLANVQNIVIGQGDSPLTDRGVAVARTAAASNAINGKGLRYWRAYCSDLPRAHRTARIVLGLEDEEGKAVEASDVDLVGDARLRELAKGAREGHAKRLSEEEALAARKRDAGHDENVLTRVPKLESIDEAFDRARQWIDAVVQEASREYYSSDESARDWTDAHGRETKRKRYDVFALTHSALIRTMIHKMVDEELPADHATTGEGSLSIPNLSRTIIDIHPYESQPAKQKESGPRVKWVPSLFQLTDVSHLHGPPPKGPPYL